MVSFTQHLLATAAAMATLGLALPAESVTKRFDWSLPSALFDQPLVGKPSNDFNCQSAHNPVVLLHGLSADDIVDLNQLQWKLNSLGYCTFSQTYGAHTLAPWIGGLVSMADSATEIADFVREVRDRTGAKKVDLVGHSEGGVMTLYVPLTQPGVADMVEHTVALGPAVHGAQYYGFTDLFYLGGTTTRTIAAAALRLLGCEACDDMATGGRVFNDFAAAAGRIVQPGVKASIIMSSSDTLVAPNVSIVDEAGVRNLMVQDRCPADKVGHAGLAWDTGIWDMVINELNEDYKGPVACSQGLLF